MKFTIKTAPQEIWKDIVGDNNYQISNLGNVRSKDMVLIKSNGVKEYKHHIKGRVLTPYVTGKGYKKGKGYLTIRISNNKGKKIHRLVAEAFIPNPDNLPQVNHIDGNTFNNSVDNLEWCTAKKNIEHSVNMGLHAVGENVKYSKLTEKQVVEIRNTYICGDRNWGAMPLSRKYGVAPTTIRNIVKEKKWRHIV